MTTERDVEITEDETTEDVEGHDSHEAPVRTQRPILYLDEADETGGTDV